MNAEEFSNSVDKFETMEDVIEHMKKEAPNKKNCLNNCGRRFRGECPIFEASPVEIDMMCKLDRETFNYVAVFCFAGCDTYAE